MIDVIVAVSNDNCGLKKLLLSVLLQTINDKINVILVFANNNLLVKYRDIIDLFLNKLKIKEIVCSDSELLLRQRGFENSNSEFVMFLGENDFFYDAFSVENAYKKLVDGDVDIVCGKLAFVDDVQQVNFIDDIYMSIVSKMFARKFLEKNKMKFDNNEFVNCYFVSKAILLANNIVIDDFVVAVCSFYNSFLEIVEFFVVDSIVIEKDLRNMVDRILLKNYLSDILKNLYNMFLLNYDDFDSLEFFGRIRPLEMLYKNYV